MVSGLGVWGLMPDFRDCVGVRFGALDFGVESVWPKSREHWHVVRIIARCEPGRRGEWNHFEEKVVNSCSTLNPNPKIYNCRQKMARQTLQPEGSRASLQVSHLH